WDAPIGGPSFDLIVANPPYIPNTDWPSLALDVRDYDRPSNEMVNYNADLIEDTLADFGLQIEVAGVKAGPTITQYAVQPYVEVEKDGETVQQRVRASRIAGLSQDIALALSASSVRMQSPIPGTNHIGIEVPNPRPGLVSLRPIIEARQFYKLKSNLALALGRTVDGTPFAADLGTMPHLLIGGTTGSGKSVCLRSLATCLVTNNTPRDLRLILIDPKMVELIRFNGLPHLLGKVEVLLDRAIGVLRWVTREMDRRYRLMEESRARNITVFNETHPPEERLPNIVVIIDELAELMNEFPDETEHLVTRLAQMARATGIHLIVATQRPSTDIITGLIKANFPARIAFAVASNTDSRVILDSVGAEELLGRGDMLYQAADAAGPTRLQGCFVSDQEIENIVTFWEKNWEVDPGKKRKIAPWERALTRAAILNKTDELLEQAILMAQEERECSASMVQRKLNIGYPRAGRLVDLMVQLGVVGDDPGGGRPRKVLIDKDLDVVEYLIDHRDMLD
ncbi:MAG: DNA translocase FtsK, partial [Chloroflexi bacterium]|nr:DNA translocase FtsK [Chloroflexota bacterium]